ncbi:helix-turn-helix transcriptional regulator [uncultured Ruegeria sp.]|uniref:helix-turn-helix domain-containing protein n=1 Tax=uncultured Ruegeria sp. TaxID=259304 RepID=UPI0026227A76|nr:helix-turn-helix transcriptional regulator [uncultured Ruegeria sp.]
MNAEKTVTIALSEYDMLRERFEDHVDDFIAREVMNNLKSGREELVPASVVGRLLNDENPVTVWREHRGLSVRKLAELSGVNRVQIGDIEQRGKTGSVITVAKLAKALKIETGDLIEWMVGE